MTHIKEGRDWPEAIRLLVRWEEGGAHLDDLLERAQLQYSRWLVMETFRQWPVIAAILEPRLRRNPRPQVQAILRLAVAELLCRDAGGQARVVHHAVEVAKEAGLSRPESGFVNAVLRGILRDPDSLSGLDLAVTHPTWLVERWRRQFGPEATDGLLAWNQALPALTISAEACPPYATETAWPGYFRIRPGQFREAEPDLKSGRVYVQDPFASIPVDLLAPRPGERILDLCAAPGGKTRLLAGKVDRGGLVLAVDRPGARLKRLQENAARVPGGRVEILGSRVEDLEATVLADWFPAGMVDALLIDVPCSNTGVIQKRPDVKVRLAEAEIARVAEYQLVLLEKAASLVRQEGRLVYSTCSLEPEENEGVVERFLAGHQEWQLSGQVLSRPWVCGHDGGGAFLLTREPAR